MDVTLSNTTLADNEVEVPIEEYIEEEIIIEHSELSYASDGTENETW